MQPPAKATQFIQAFGFSLAFLLVAFATDSKSGIAVTLCSTQGDTTGGEETQRGGALWVSQIRWGFEHLFDKCSVDGLPTTSGVKEIKVRNYRGLKGRLGHCYYGCVRLRTRTKTTTFLRICEDA